MVELKQHKLDFNIGIKLYDLLKHGLFFWTVTLNECDIIQKLELHSVECIPPPQQPPFVPTLWYHHLCIIPLGTNDNGENVLSHSVKDSDGEKSWFCPCIWIHTKSSILGQDPSSRFCGNLFSTFCVTMPTNKPTNQPENKQTNQQTITWPRLKS